MFAYIARHGLYPPLQQQREQSFAGKFILLKSMRCMYVVWTQLLFGT